MKNVEIWNKKKFDPISSSHTLGELKSFGNNISIIGVILRTN